MAKILLVEDDQSLSGEVKNWLHKQEHYTIDQAFSAKDAMLFLETYTYDVVVLDWELPDGAGIDILRKFRTSGAKTPVLMLTGRDSVLDKTTGLDTGSDDYLTKPFQPEELSARLRALIRRFSDSTTSNAIKFSNVVLDAITRRVEVDLQEVKFQPAEFDLLYFLCMNPDHIFPATQLMSSAWPDSERATEASLRVCVSRIRQKIKDPDATPKIENLPGQGYRFNSLP